MLLTCLLSAFKILLYLGWQSKCKMKIFHSLQNLLRLVIAILELGESIPFKNNGIAISTFVSAGKDYEELAYEQPVKNPSIETRVN